MTARDEAIAALKAFAPDLTVRMAVALVDAIPASVLAQLAIDRGGLEQVTSYHDARCDRDGARASCWHPQGYGDCTQEHVGRMVPVYAITEDPS